MNPSSRPANPSDDSTAVTAKQESGGDLPAVAGAAGASAQTSRSNDDGKRISGHPGSAGEGEELESTRRSKAAVDNRDNRCSSGYYSFEGDSLPNSPLSPRPLTAEKSTQTPSPSCQVMKHALLRVDKAHGGGPATQLQHGSSTSRSSTQQGSAAGDMEAEVVGQELRRIGDDFNRLFLLRGAAGRHRHVVIHPYPLPHVHQEPTVLFCMGILLLVIGRIIYLQSSTNSQDHSQV
ncbi:hypothetical protein JOB18_043042 [Solea senegalensis]|uniref:Bcl-2-like protein 11 n=1 Tax=Solea senegalensis TaxID=28829 RepID=A0AAV6S8C5_SOLSE|nr:uncharacterized protein LOC122782014 [Solea senegalensis]KAG7512922.1 hypothetical protein JOB18_043042 [Solea senegalensis]